MNYNVKVALFVLIGILEISNFMIFIKGRKYKLSVSGLKVFVLEKYFYFGYVITKVLKVKNCRKVRRRRQLLEMYDNQKAEEIARSATYAPYTYVALFSPLILLVYAVSGNAKVFILLLLLLAFICAYFDIWLLRKIKTRHTEILCEYATVLTKMSLLVNAGITASESFERVALSSEGLLYKEMQKTVSDIRNGMSYNIALNELAVRCGCKEIKKFVSLYKQNLIKGGPEFPFLLSEMADSVWSERKGRARLASTAASQKLLLPILMMFIGILLMVIVPAFENLL